MLASLKCNLRLFLKKFIAFGIVKTDYIVVKFFGIGLTLVLDCFWSRSQFFGFDLCLSLGNIIGSRLGPDVCGLDYITGLDCSLRVTRKNV